MGIIPLFLVLLIEMKIFDNHFSFIKKKYIYIYIIIFHLKKKSTQYIKAKDLNRCYIVL